MTETPPPRHRWITFIPVILLVLLVAVLAYALAHPQDPSSRFASHIGESVPATSLAAIAFDGQKSPPMFATDNWHGQPYIVNFFASWCVPCHAEHDDLLELADAHIPVIGIAYKDTPAAIHDFLAKNANPFAVIVVDPKGQTGIGWGITGVPETFVIDKDGMIRFHQAGPLTDDMVHDQILPLWRSLTE